MKLSKKVQHIVDKYTEDKAHIKLTLGFSGGAYSDYAIFNSRGKERDKEKFFYEIGSVTKTITACMILKKVAGGEMQLSDPIDRFIPELKKKKYPTLFQLLTHTSGYGEVPKRYWLKAVLEQKNIRYNQFNFLDQSFAEKDMLSYIESHNSNRQFGFKYSNVGYGVLGYILGRTEGKLWKELAQAFLREELGLRETFVELPRHNMLLGYDKNNVNCGNFLWKEKSVLASAGCLYSTVEDMLLYGKLQLLEQKLYFNAMHRPYGKALKGSRIGLGFMIDSDGIVWHSGGTGGFHTYFGFHKRSGGVAVVLSNYAVDADKKMLQEIGRAMLLESANPLELTQEKSLKVHCDS